MGIIKYICACLLSAVCMALSAPAQQTSNSAATGKLTGIIMDYPGVYIPDARIIIEGSDLSDGCRLPTMGLIPLMRPQEHIRFGSNTLAFILLAYAVSSLNPMA